MELVWRVGRKGTGSEVGAGKLGGADVSYPCIRAYAEVNWV